MIDRELLVKHGTLRRCDNCELETTERKVWREHERRTGHSLNTDGRDAVKKYTPEEQAARQKYGRKATKAMGI